MVPSAQSIYGEGGGSIQNYYLLGNIINDNTVWDQTNPYLGTGFTSRTSQGWNWTELRRINYFLQNYSKANISQERKDHFAGIARFFGHGFTMIRLACLAMFPGTDMSWVPMMRSFTKGATQEPW